MPHCDKLQEEEVLELRRQREGVKSATLSTLLVYWKAARKKRTV
jgi:hypothetical protein